MYIVKRTTEHPCIITIWMSGRPKESGLAAVKICPGTQEAELEADVIGAVGEGATMQGSGGSGSLAGSETDTC